MSPISLVHTGLEEGRARILTTTRILEDSDVLISSSLFIDCTNDHEVNGSKTMDSFVSKIPPFPTQSECTWGHLSPLGPLVALATSSR